MMDDCCAGEIVSKAYSMQIHINDNQRWEENLIDLLDDPTSINVERKMFGLFFNHSTQYVDLLFVP